MRMFPSLMIIHCSSGKTPSLPTTRPIWETDVGTPSELIAKRRHWSSHQYFCVADIPLDKRPDTNRVVRNLRQGGILGARDAGDIVKARQNEFETMVCFGHEAEKKEDMVVLEFVVCLLLNE